MAIGIAYGKEDLGNRNVDDQDFGGGRRGMFSGPLSGVSWAYFFSRFAIWGDAIQAHISQRQAITLTSM